MNEVEKKARWIKERELETQGKVQREMGNPDLSKPRA
jgi:hypothetical protein